MYVPPNHSARVLVGHAGRYFEHPPILVHTVNAASVKTVMGLLAGY
jgi:hypothetical protein